MLSWLTSLTRLGSEAKAQFNPLRSRLLNDPYYRFQSLEEVQVASELGVQIDVNRADIDDWLRLPGVSIHQARTLVALTQTGVLFHCLDDVAAALNLPVHRLKPFEPVLAFRYYDAESIETIQRTNPNTASVEALVRVPAIDLFLARAIVQHRQTYGAYRNLADLQQRLSLTTQLTTDLVHYLYF
ncbi:ComEA family DNA-binding protein [Oscillatoria sp. FACHB-1407]|uniref:helix-hairpin-helix domain-containing protein n=1 Tax=Oscillatoria sp. FACHB-1407 TaxID=2692847 RepID=UPI00168956D9|nr:ComEA family DNA-binding protein [Oscillatoria sp. FACHB-1407]MBD2461668.1 ComEA family DNA-binding protein [Oscillatoria sp. FACHB-1407]